MTSPEFVAPEFVDDVLTAARTIPGVHDVAAVFRRRAKSGPTLPTPGPTLPTPEPASTPEPAPTSEPAATPGLAPVAGAVVTDASRTDEAGSPRADLDGGTVRIPEGCPATLQEALRAAADQTPDRGTTYIRAGREDEHQTYAELLAEAERVLAGLRAAGLRAGDAALSVFADNRACLTAFWACVLGGFVPAPVAVAPTYDEPNEVTRKLHNAWNLLGRPVLLTDAETVDVLGRVRDLWQEPGVRILTVEELLTHRPDHDWFDASPEDPVLNLLTSGSTGVPKCVRHTNASVVARTLGVAEMCGLTADDVSLIWMPLDHVTVAMYNARDVILRCRHVNARTGHFLSDPLLWLDWMDRYRVTNTWAPNFAYSMVNELAAEVRGRSWDLSCVREMVNAGEPVIAATSHRFLELLAPHGLRADAMTPCWGMSETCSGVTYTRQSRADRTAGTVCVDPATLGGSIGYLPPGSENAVVLSTVGRPIPGVRLRVVDKDGAVLPEGRIGELRITGSTMMLGYFNNDDANREAYDADGWFRTGDLAFVKDGEVVIAGRVKDQIIVRGVNYLAHEIESVVEQVAGVRVTFVAAAGLREPGESTDRLVIFFVPQDHEDAASPPFHHDGTGLASRIRETLGKEVGLTPDVLIPVTEAEFPKTSSGKIQRSALVAELRAGTFDGRLIETEPERRPDTWLVRRRWEPLGPVTETGTPTSTDTSASDGTANGVRLVVGEDQIVERLDIKDAIVAVRNSALGEEAPPGRDSVIEEAPGRYRAAPDTREAARRLLTAVTEAHGPVTSLILALPGLAAATPGGDPTERLSAATAELAAFAGALADGGFGSPLLLVLTAGAVHVREGDAVDLGACALPALVRTAITEMAPLVVRQVDLPAASDEWPKAVRSELADRGHAGILAVREGLRWQPRLVPVDDEMSAAAEPAIVTGGLYLVTGGLGGIAHEICGHLLAAYGVKLSLVGRRSPEGVQAQRLAELSALGSVEYRLLDLGKPGVLEAAAKTAEARWRRPLDGILHLAGADPTGQWADLERHTIANETPETYAEHYRAKVTGTLSVGRVLEKRPNASLVLFGSVNGEFGGHSFGAYSAANGFLVGFADYWRHERGRRVHCLGWSAWTGVGMNSTQPTAPARHRGFRPIEPAHGLRLFRTAIESPHHYLLVGLDLSNPAIVNELAADWMHISELLVAYTGEDVETEEVMRALNQTIRRCPVPVSVVRVPRITSGDDPAQLLLDADQALRAQEARQAGRPTADPANDLERRLAGIWSETLNRPVVGRDESFFDLGGNSLRAARLLALVDRDLTVRLTSHQLYTSPTVAGMAAVIARVRDEE